MPMNSEETEHLLPTIAEMDSKTQAEAGDATSIDHKSSASEANRTFSTETGPSGYVDNIHVALHNDNVVPYRLYKRRFFGLIHLSLLNIIVSWSWLTFAAVSTTTAHYFNVSESDVNWLSTGFLFAFVVASPLTMWTLNRGVKPAMIVSSALLIVGSWIRYAGARGGGEHGKFGVVVLGQIIMGFAQPFVLAAPTRFSDLWFSDKGRITATALASLANPFGGALGQLIGPFLATKQDQIPNLVLYVAIITTVLAIPSVFIPSKPPTPPTATSCQAAPALNRRVLMSLLKNPSFHLVAWPFMIYVSAFNSTSTLLNQILRPYGFTEDDAGIDGALLIVVGLVAAAIMSPIVDRHKRLRLPVIKTLIPIIAAMYLALIFVPRTRAIPGPYAVSSILGASSFALLPLALELLVEVSWPVGPEVTSTICWTGGQLGGGVFILIMDALRGNAGSNDPPRSMFNALVFQAVIAWLVVPLPMLLGFWGLGTERRLETAREQAGL